MKKLRNVSMIGVAAAALALPLPVSAQGATAAGAGSAEGLPYDEFEKSPSGVEYITGGVGIDAQERLERAARQKDVNLKLVFTLNEGNYIADVDVAVKDRKGQTVVQDTADGPFFFAKLPPGRYTISATYGGKTVTRQVNVTANRLRTEYLRWPSNPETDFPLPREQARGTGGTATGRS